VNVLKQQKQNDIGALLRAGVSHREIERRLQIDRETVSRYARIFEAINSKPASLEGVATGILVKTSQASDPRPPAQRSEKIPKQAASACKEHREWVEKQVGLGRNAMSIYQDLVEQWGFTHKYNSVKRFVRKLKANAPERFDILEYLPGEEAQVDYGQGAPTFLSSEKTKKPALFVMTLKYSRKSFRKVNWKADQESWCRLHEEAFRFFGGVPQYVVLDNLKQGVLRPDIYEPELNPLYRAVLAHYGAVADAARVADPNRKGTVESAIQHTQSTALKGRTFETIEKQNEWLLHWEERWASPRIHGRTKRQVSEMFLEEKPYLKPLPLQGFRYFEEGVRTVDDYGMVQVKGSFYAALPSEVGSEVRVRIYDQEIEIFSLTSECLRRHQRAERKGQHKYLPSDRLFNPSRETERLLQKAQSIGENTVAFCKKLFEREGRIGNKMLYGITNLTRHHKCEAIDRACEQTLKAEIYSYQAVKKILERTSPQATPELQQTGELIRPIKDYQQFWEINSLTGT
jgi:transposase